MCIGRTIFRTALIGGLAAGGLALAFPDKAVHVFHGMKSRVNAVVAEATDDPVILRRQLQELADELPNKIAELHGEISEVDAQIAMITRDTEIAEGVIALTGDDLKALDEKLAQAAALGRDGVVAIHFKGSRFDVRDARAEFNRINEIRVAYQDRLAANQNDLKYLTEQKVRLTDVVTKLEQEEATIEAQMWQIDRKIAAISRNEKLADQLEDREDAMQEYDTRFDASSLAQIQSKLRKWETEVGARLKRFDRKIERDDYEQRVIFELDQQTEDSSWDVEEVEEEDGEPVALLD
jgi:chromosome segregation ATPase